MSVETQKDVSALRMRLEDDLQSVYLTEALQALHLRRSPMYSIGVFGPAIQLALERFAKVAVRRKA
jgi:hypothetical protein